MKKKSMISLVLALILIATMCVYPVSASAASSEKTTELMVAEDGWSYVEFTVPETYSARTAYTDTVWPVCDQWWYGENDMLADGNYVSVAARGENLGITVSIQMKKKLTGSVYTPVTSIATLQCDGVSHTVFSSFEVEKGATYRFFYKANGTESQSPKVFLAANFWNG